MTRDEEKRVDETQTLRHEPAPDRPQRIGRYPVEGEVGRGGMGVVYIVRDPRLGRRIALKLLPDEIAHQPDALADFEREARLLAALNHSNIATIFSLEEDDEAGSSFFTMELIDGTDLDREIRSGTLPLDDTLVIARQVASALQAAHTQGVIHRDLKPKNIMIGHELQTKVLDFGIATGIGDCADHLRAVEADDAISGTPGYMSPEHLYGEPLDGRTDIWAFGCVLFEMVTGRMAFSADSLQQRIDDTLAGTVPWDIIPGETPEEVSRLIERCLELDLEKRLGTIAEARRIIEDLIHTRALPEDALPTSTEDAKGNLPRQLSNFVGRDRQLEDVTTLIETQPLTTLTGIGGSGKTRLAIETARRSAARFPHGSWIVELAQLAGSALVPQTVCDVLGCSSRGPDAVAALCEHIGSRRMLLVLDNCEHVIEACAWLTKALLERCPELRVLATSREALDLPGESLYPVPPLALPVETKRQPTRDELLEVESVRLFVERARAANARFSLDDALAPIVARICRRLDGVPLAIELAAVRTSSMTLVDLESRLSDRFRILKSSRATAPRQRTLRATIDWSYGQLDAREQLLLRRLSVFVGGWDLEAAEVVCSGGEIEEWDIVDLLSQLVQKSLVEITALKDDRPRHRLLETIREYAVGRLEESGEGAEVRERHRSHFIALIERARAELVGPKQSAWFRVLDVEHDNVRAALDACIESSGFIEDGMALVKTVSVFWEARGFWNESRSRLREILEHPEAQQRSHVRARLLQRAASIALVQGDSDEARTHAEESLAIQRDRGSSIPIADALIGLGIVARRQGDERSARDCFEEALAIFRDDANKHGIATCLGNLANVELDCAHLERACELQEEALGVFRELGHRNAVTIVLSNLGGLKSHLEDFDGARACCEEALSLCRELGMRGTERNALHNLGSIHASMNRLEESRRYFEESLAINVELSSRSGMAETLERLAWVAQCQGDGDAARAWGRDCVEHLRGLDAPMTAAGLLDTVSWIASLRDRPEESARLEGAAEALRAAPETPALAGVVSEETPWMAEVTARLGGERVTELEDEGRRMGPSEVLDLADDVLVDGSS